MQKVKLKRFYVYVDYRRNGDVFYVGKGSGGRYFTPLRKFNAYWMKIVAKDGGHSRRIIQDDLTEAEAFRLERELIQKYASTVVNATLGGEGHKHSERTKMKISVALKGNKNGRFKKVSLAERKRIGEWARNRVVSKETREKISLSSKGRKGFWKGKKFSEDHKRKLAKSHLKFPK